ncbi:Postreplication repair E3 ubiquitin-protein ligase rad18 [Daldinia childiae]|uniref:Postreplication repair E3 ubiquitin-protein ligase rad18 n=1 Tax=Daldinia childiae TaxID=326645 RepID=UPI001445AEF6|nr:Postreplication repair E3 ubiquitin-protein ligase rad18 [Daldinia childiae]KAF3066570.1 Postreplication repair E3 ubiquitin-protein ligase rad18 [Daldinia childiae]
MNNNAILEPFEDVSDSTDWLSTPLSGVAAVEAALRCQVCKDFYKTPMLTSCNHTFCSICIRRALSNDGKCPLCRTSEQEMKLRSNWSMEEVVVAFTKTRPDVLLFAKRSQDAITEPGKRKLGETEDSDSASQRSGKRLRSSTRLSKSRSMEMTSEMARLEADVPYQDLTDFEPNDGLVACPICLLRMKPLQVDRHLDTSCPGEPQPQRTPSKPPSRSTSIPNAFSSSSSPKKASARNFERLPAVNYSMLKEPQLRKKLQEQGLSAAGGRQMLEKRHKEWTTIWNANCDSQYPRRKGDLLHDLDVWERTVGSRAPTNSRTLSLGAQIKDKDFDGAAWASKHDNSFKDLIANARRNKVLMGRKSSEDEKPGSGMQSKDGNKGNEPTPQPDSEMISSLEHSEPQEQVDSVTQATGIIDLTGEIASSNASAAVLSDEGEGRVDLDASSRTTVIS